MRFITGTAIIVALLGFGHTATAFEPAPAPNTTFLIGHDVFSSGQSNNLGPAVNQTIDESWLTGPCTELDNYAGCDELLFGLTLYAGPTCTEVNVPLISPQEDGGLLVKDRIRDIHNEAGTTFCASNQFIPHDAALENHHDFTFPEGVGASEAILDSYWARPHLTLMVIGEMPQTTNSRPDNRVKKSLETACSNLFGVDGTLPSMPTWVMMARRPNDGAEAYASLLSAAGGTGRCCYGIGCDIETEQINVCTHIADGRSDADIRFDLNQGKYSCDGGPKSFSTGVMDFGANQNGTLPHIRCHLTGDRSSSNCDSNDREGTDVLGIFACIRQIPRDMAPEDVKILYCPDEGTETSNENCEELTEENGGIEFIDPQRTLFKLNDQNGECAGVIGGDGDVEIIPCPNEGKYCQVEGALGRCAFGQWACTKDGEICRSIFEPMPEICNGLDDDCDGNYDNMSTSWEQSRFSGMSLPQEHTGLDCRQKNVCVCPMGESDNHAGQTFSSYLEAWDPVCECGAALEFDDSASSAPESTHDAEVEAACAATGTDAAVPALFVMLVGLFGFIRRRYDK